jgi:hypothetical protein
MDSKRSQPDGLTDPLDCDDPKSTGPASCPASTKQELQAATARSSDEVLSDQLSDYEVKDGHTTAHDHINSSRSGRDLGRASGMLHTEEVTGSNPVSPTQASAVLVLGIGPIQPRCMRRDRRPRLRIAVNGACPRCTAGRATT